MLAGASLGYVLERGDFCFHSTWREVFTRGGDHTLLKAYLTLLLVSTPLVQLLVGFGVIDPYIAPFAWGSALVGGLVFALGMVVAQTCVSGMFYKLGHGMLGMVVALAAWAVGDLLAYRGPLNGVRESLQDTVVHGGTGGGDQHVLFDWIDTPLNWIVVFIAVLAMGFHLCMGPVRKSEDRAKLLDWKPLGLAAAGVLSAAWLLVAINGNNYTFGTSGVPSQISRWVSGDDVGTMWIPLALVSLIPGAFLAAKRSGTLWVRGESGARYGQLGVGGLLMGIGAGIAGGCNLGHSMVGVPLLSMGSIATTIVIILGLDMFVRIANKIPKSQSPSDY